MRSLLAIALLVGTINIASAFELGPSGPARSDQIVLPAASQEARQGGDTIADAVAITVPGTYTGTTTGYAQDYDEMCPYGGNAPDVVYAVVPDADIALDFDLCLSSYDTKLIIYDEALNLVACNDDFHFDDPPCFTYSSKLVNIQLQGGATYYIVVTGYGNEHGPYQLDIVRHDDCVLECPLGAQLENEPPLEDGYVDNHNGGCGSPDWQNAFQPITAPLFCGASGWYQSSQGLSSRDTDWFHITIPAVGALEITADAEFATYMFELAPQDCGTVGVVQNVVFGPCQEASMTIDGEPGSLVWFWVGPTVFEQPYYFDRSEYRYVLHLNLDEPVASDQRTWSTVKSLFR